MDIWERINMNEIKYYCFSNIIDFDCYPFGKQIESIVCMFYYYGITEFEIEDIKDILPKTANTSSKG